MDTTTQFLIVALVIVAAIAYLGRSIWKSWFGKSTAGCSSGCGKCEAKPEKTQPGRFQLPQV